MSIIAALAIPSHYDQYDSRAGATSSVLACGVSAVQMQITVVVPSVVFYQFCIP